MSTRGKLEEQILYCLEKFPQTRDDDMVLAIFIWVTYYAKELKKIDERYYVSLESIVNTLPRQDGIKRIRAKIQNEKHLFLPTTELVRKKRLISEQEWYEWSLIK